MSSTTPVSAVMTAEVVTVRPDQSLAEAADVLAEHGIGAAPAVDDSGSIVGLLRDEDLLISESRLHLPTVEGVTERGFVSLAPDASLEDLATAMHEGDVTHVPIVDSRVVVGIATRGDIVRHLVATT